MACQGPLATLLILCCTGATFSLKSHVDFVGSLVNKPGTACFEGSVEYLEIRLSRVLKTSLGSMYEGMEVLPVPCAEQGFHSLMDESDECWPGASKIMKKNKLKDIGNYVKGHAGFLNLFETYDKQDGRKTGDASDLAICGACDEDSKARNTCIWWTPRMPLADGCLHGPTSPTNFYSKDYCAAVLEQAESYPDPAKLNWPAPWGSFETSTGSACFEGEVAYLEHSLSRASKTPLAPMYRGSEISTKSCEERGFHWKPVGYPTDEDLMNMGMDMKKLLKDIPTDECFNKATKYLKKSIKSTDAASKAKWGKLDFDPYIFESTGIYNLFYTYDAENFGLVPDGFAMDWAVCGACGEHSLARTHEFWTQKRNSKIDFYQFDDTEMNNNHIHSKYTEEYCQTVLAKAKPSDPAELDWP